MMAILLIAATAHAQLAVRGEYLFKGRLIDADSGISVNLSHIRNMQQNTLTVSNPDGAFTMPVKGGDTLMISRIGYVTIKYPVPATDPEKVNLIFFQAKTEELQEVVITKFPAESRFKDQLLALELPEEGPGLRLPHPSTVVTPSLNGDVKLFSASGMISGFANRFNDKERGRQFKRLIEYKEQREAYIATKFNKQIVQQITGLEDDEKLNEFMKFCVLEEDFLYKANEYQIHEAVLGCFKDFIASR